VSEPAAEVEIGVGPWPGGLTSWPADERYDPDLLRDGDSRNVTDGYRYWRVEAIAADLAARAHPFHVAIENFDHDFNIGSVVRTANACNAAGVHVVGRRRWNRRGAMVTDRYLDVGYHEDVAALVAWADLAGLPLVGIDNTPGSQPLETYDLPREVVLLFGQEGPGLSSAAAPTFSDRVDPNWAIDSTTDEADTAAAIAMHAWVRRWVFNQPPAR